MLHSFNDLPKAIAFMKTNPGTYVTTPNTKEVRKHGHTYWSKVAPFEVHKYPAQ